MVIRRGKDITRYEAKGHYDMIPMRVHGKDATGSDMLTIGLSWFLPGGGAERSVLPEGMELVYYIMENEMTLITDEGEEVLNAGDSVLIKGGDARGIRNDTKRPSAMLVIGCKKPE